MHENRLHVVASILLVAGTVAGVAVAQAPVDHEPITLASWNTGAGDVGSSGGGSPVARSAGALAGRVVSHRAPLVAVGVYAYQVAELRLTRATTNRLGEFQFASLPAGLYKIIAHKPGFVPAVVLVTRATADLYQYLDVELANDQPGGSEEDDFWTVRSRIPADVLREIQYDEARLLLDPLEEPALSTRMTAESGVSDWFGSSVELTGGELDLEAALGDVRLALQGEFQRLEQTSLSRSEHSSREALEVDLRHADSSQVVVSGLRSTWQPDGQPSNLTRYGLQWTQRLGSGRSSLSAGYVDETNFGDHRLAAFGLPQASTALRVEGSYHARFSANASLQTGVRYRQVEARASLLPIDLALAERLDLFSFGDYRVQPALLIQFGLYTTLADGSLAFNPRAGLVVDLGSFWQLEATVQQRLQQGAAEVFPYMSTLYEGANLDCGAAEQSCYRVKLVRRTGEHEGLSAALVHREFAEPLRLHLGAEDLLSRHETLLLVPGDRLPELQVSFSRQLGPSVLAHFQSTFAQGGGGMLSGSGAGMRNQVGYLVTSLGTNIKPSATELQLAYHQLQQRLVSMAADGTTHRPDLDLDRLQFLVVQGLPFGFADWAVSLDVQLSRGLYPWSQPTDDSDAIRKQVVGGIAVRF